MAKRFAYFTMGIIILVSFHRKVNVRCCMCELYDIASISEVDTGTFSETIPQTGKVTERNQLMVPIDQLYLSRIKVGLTATATVNSEDIVLRISQIDTTRIDGIFSVLMDFVDTTVTLKHDQSVRLRILLSETREATMIPVGGFYKDTGGEWIYVLKDEKYFVKRNIRLGKKNSDSFVVLEGLQPGEKVLTSTYMNLAHKNEVSLWEIERKKPVSMM